MRLVYIYFCTCCVYMYFYLFVFVFASRHGCSLSSKLCLPACIPVHLAIAFQIRPDHKDLFVDQRGAREKACKLCIPSRCRPSLKKKKETFPFDARSSTSQSDSRAARRRHGGVSGRKTKRRGAAVAAFP